ncbi:52ab3c9d-e1a4-4654-93de-6a98cd9fe607 [Thermothielavioides terrestris]|uniref:52ab3c9d-e1a4-4654-93de-6a98cd9fe607 n=1 Tax=Thermothielavioides terrestris TaxID=2587410 RepID=A0A3S4AIT9_9PEZI|nr:52ab3c9d-e1a4-4654-93de-6a98cd9fe607 [Thermothielavioides terrestris]
MANSFLPFEPAGDSVIEILWDVALAFFVVRLALLYAALVFGSALVLSALLHRLLAPGATTTTPSPSATPALPLPLPLPALVLTLSAIYARLLVVRCEVPRAAWFRLAIGGVAAAVVVLAEALAGLVGPQADVSEKKTTEVQQG